MHADNTMTAPVIDILPSSLIADAARLMIPSEISVLPVITREGRLVGTIAECGFSAAANSEPSRSVRRGLNSSPALEKPPMSKSMPAAARSRKSSHPVS